MLIISSELFAQKQGLIVVTDESIKEDLNLNFTRDSIGKYNDSGKEEGLWIQVCSNNLTSYNYIIGNYRNGNREGQWIEVLDHKIRYQLNYKDGLLHGCQLEYDRDGKIIRSLNFAEGKLHGYSSYFSSNGELIAILEYKDGKFLKDIYLRDSSSLQRINNAIKVFPCGN